MSFKFFLSFMLFVMPAIGRLSGHSSYRLGRSFTYASESPSSLIV